MSVKLLTKQCLKLLTLKGRCTGWCKATHIKIPHYWKSRVTAHILNWFPTSSISSASSIFHIELVNSVIQEHECCILFII